MSFELLKWENRIGTFYIHTSRIFDGSIRQIFDKCVIVRAERMYHVGDVIEYVAFHPDFKTVGEGDVPTEYVFIQSRSTGGIIIVENSCFGNVPELTNDEFSLTSRKVSSEYIPLGEQDEAA